MFCYRINKWCPVGELQFAALKHYLGSKCPSATLPMSYIWWPELGCEMSSGPFFQVSCLKQIQPPLLPISASLPLVEFLLTLYQSEGICHDSVLWSPGEKQCQVEKMSCVDWKSFDGPCRMSDACWQKFLGEHACYLQEMSQLVLLDAAPSWSGKCSCSLLSCWGFLCIFFF